MTARATSFFAFLSLTCAMAAAKPARAVDPFEMQVYDGSVDAPGTPGLELHVNTVPNGRKTAVAPELPPNHQTHFTLEPSLGITPWWELGGYVQSSLEGDGTYSYAGVKLRSKFVTPKDYIRDWRFGVNLEVSRIPAKFDRARWGGEIRPIIAFENKRWILAVNPILELSFAGPERSAAPSFAPAMMAKVKVGEVAAFGLEYYADFGSIARGAPARSEEHYLFEAFDLLAVNDFEFNAGVGEGLSDASNAFVIKAIVGYSFDKLRLWSGTRGN
jgi:hypothetical protein